MSGTTNLSPGPVDFRQFLEPEQEGFMIPHGSKAFSVLHQRVTTNIKQLLDVKQGDVAFLSTSGTGAIEALLLNVLQSGDKILVITNGFFGERIVRMAERFGLLPVTIDCSWDEPFDVARVLAFIASKQFAGVKAVIVVHLETSTGIINTIAPIGEALRETPALFLVDAVSSVGSHTLSMADWCIDGLVTVSYKGLLSPPGISILVLSDKYTQVMQTHTSPSYYFDLQKTIAQSRQNTTSCTVAVNAITAFNRVIEHILHYGKKEYVLHCNTTAQAIRTQLSHLDCQIYGKTGHSYAVTALMLPEPFDMAQAVVELERTCNIFIGKGLGTLEGKVIRISHYGQFGENTFTKIVNSMGNAIDKYKDSAQIRHSTVPEREVTL